MSIKGVCCCCWFCFCFLFFYLFVHVLVKLGGCIGLRCRLLLYSELLVKLTSAKSICRKVFVDYMYAVWRWRGEGGGGEGNKETLSASRGVTVMWMCKSAEWGEKNTCCCCYHLHWMIIVEPQAIPPIQSLNLNLINPLTQRSNDNTKGKQKQKQRRRKKGREGEGERERERER